MQSTSSVGLKLFSAIALLATGLVAVVSGGPRVAAQQPPIEWELPPDPYRVETPDWYESSRVHIHSRWNIHRCFALACSLEADPEGFWGFGGEVEEWGPTVITRWMKGQDEGAWWESAVGEAHPTVATEGNVARRLIDDARARGIDSVSYYRHVEDAWAVANHPEWTVRDVSGNPVTDANYGNWQSFSSPYGDFLNTRIGELIEMGSRGIYFDYRHIPAGGDYHPDAVARYTELYGGSPYGQSAARLAAWRQELLRDFFSRAQATVKAVDPEAMIIGSANTVSLDVLRDSVDVAKYEQGFEASLGGQRTASTLLLDTTGASPHLWTRPAEEDSDAVMADYVAYGTIYNRDIREHEAPDIPHNIRASYGRVFELNGQVSEAMVDVQPWRDVRILVPGNYMVAKTNPLNSAIASAFTTLDARNVPVGFASWSQVAAGGVDPNASVFIDPVNSRSYFSSGSGARAAIWQAVLDFEAAGGTAMFREDLSAGWQNRLAAQPRPVSLSGGSAAVGFVPYVSDDGARLVVNVAAQNRSGMALYLSADSFAEPVAATESVTGAELDIDQVDDGWTIEVPSAPMMAQVVVNLVPGDSTALGDVDCSGTVDDADIAALLGYSIGAAADAGSCPEPGSSSLHAGVGDIDDDGATGLADALLIAQCLAGDPAPGLTCTPDPT